MFDVLREHNQVAKLEKIFTRIIDYLHKNDSYQYVVECLLCGTFAKLKLQD